MRPHFDWSAHLRPGVSERPSHTANPSANHAGNIVAANNELIHPVVERLFSRFIATFDAEQVRHYTYHDAVAERVARYLGQPADGVLLSAGSDAAIQMVLSAIGAVSGRLILQWPNYPGYQSYACLNGIDVDAVFTMGLPSQEVVERLCRAMSNGHEGLVAVTNPSGMDGSCLPFDAMQRLAEEAQRHGHVMLIDEAYVGFSGTEHGPLLSQFENVVILRSFSKFLGLAGLRIGTILASDRGLSRYLERWSTQNPVSTVSAQFLSYCLDNSAEFDRARAEIVSCRDWVTECARALLPGWNVPDSAANFVYLGAPSPTAAAEMLNAFDEAGIRVRDMARFDSSSNAARVTVGHRALSERIVAVIERVAALQKADVHDVRGRS